MADLIKKKKQEEEEKRRRESQAAKEQAKAAVVKPAQASSAKVAAVKQNATNKSTRVTGAVAAGNTNNASIHNQLGSNVNASDNSTMKVDMSKIKTTQQAANVAMRISTDAERDAFLKDFQNQQKRATGTKPRIDDLRSMVDSATKSGVYAKTVAKRQEEEMTRRNQLKSLSGLYDANGKAININTASYATVVQGIRSIADVAKRNAAATALKEMTETSGSRFYGQTFDAALTGSYLGNPTFNEANYKEITGAYVDAFYAQSGYEEQNAQQYLSFYNAIQDGAYTDSVKRQLKEALDASWQNTTGRKAPSVEAVAAANATVNAAQNAAETQEEEDKPNVLEQAWSTVTGWFKGEETTPEEAKEGVPTEDKNSVGEAVGKFISGEWVMDPEWVEGYEQREGTPKISQEPGFTGMYASATVSDVPIVKPGQQKQYIEVKDDADVLRAYYAGKLDQVSDADKRGFLSLIQNQYAKQVLGLVTDEESAKAALIGNEGAEMVGLSNLTSLGVKFYDAYSMINSESFPDELRDDGMLMLLNLTKRAALLEEQGALGGDEYLPAMERLLTTDKWAQAELEKLYGARDALIANKNGILTAQQRETEKAIQEAREAFIRNDASAEQIELVYASAPSDAPKKAYKDKTYKTMFAEVNYTDFGYFDEEGGAFYNSALYANLPKQDEETISEYKFGLSCKMVEMLQLDARAAASLGMSLEDFYSRVGGMTSETLANRASAQMVSEAKSVTQEDAVAFDEIKNDGSIGWFATGVLSTSHGTLSAYEAYADTLYMGVTEGNVIRTGEKMKIKYEQEYGAEGRETYRAEMQDYIDSGLLDEDYAKALQSAMDNVGDVYSIGIDPEDAEGFIVRSGAWARRNLKMQEAYVTENGSEAEQEAFRLLSSSVNNAWQMAVSYAATMGAGAVLGGAAATAKGLEKAGKIAQKIGFAYGYGRGQWSENVEKRMAEDFDRTTAVWLGSLDTYGSYKANFMTFGNVLTRATGMDSLASNAMDWLFKNPIGALKGQVAVRSFVSGVFAGVENVAEEVGDTFKEGLYQKGIDKWLVPVFQKANNGEDVRASDYLMATLQAFNPLEVAKYAAESAAETVNSAPEIAIQTSLFALAGAAGNAFNTYKGYRTAQGMPIKSEGLAGFDSVQMATDIVNGRSNDVAGFLDALKADCEDNRFITLFNEAAETSGLAHKTIMNLIRANGRDAQVKEIEAKNEQIAAHKEKAANSQNAINTAVQSLNEAQNKIDNGTATDEDVQVVIDSTESIAKNKNGLDEANREAAQKEAEVKALQDEGMQEARAKASRDQKAETARMMQSMVEMAPQIAENAKQSERANIEKRIDDLNTQIQQEFDKGDDADYELIDNLFAQAGTLGAYLDDMQAQEIGEEEAQALKEDVERRLTEIAENKAAHTSAETQAVMEARETTAKLESEQKDLQGVVKRLKSDTVYVDDAQAATILYETGAKSITEVNKRLGTKLTRTQGKGIPLDGSFYAELRDMAPAYFREEWDAHPEEAVVSLMQRSKLLKNDIEESKQEELRANEAYRAKASERFNAVNKKAAEIPPGYALSQFENQNIQSSDVSTETTNEMLEGTTHKVDTHKELEANAARRIAENGLKKTISELIQTEELNAEDVVTGRECLKLLKRNGDFRAHAVLSVKLGKEATKAGKKLNVFSLFQKQSAANAAADTLEMAEAYNKRKGKYAEEVDPEAQMSLGDTQHQPFMEAAVSLSTSDPAMQKLASDVRKRSGLSVYWANMPDGMRGFFDRAKGIIVLNQKIGAAQGAYVTAIHEFTHFMETSKQYADYSNAILKAAYGAEYEGSTGMLEDEAAIRDEYATRGEELTPELLRKELVAAATEQVLLGDESFMRRLFSGGNGGVAVRILSGMDSFIRKSEAKGKGKNAVKQYELIEAARAKMQDAIANAGKWKAETANDSQMSIQVERKVQGAQTQLGNQQMISDESYDSIEAPMPDSPVEMKPEPDGVQQEIQDPAGMNAREVTSKVIANIDALNKDVSTDNEWGLPLNPFQLEQIKKYKLNGVKLPGLAYNRATTKQRMLCAILATPSDRIGPNKMTLTEQLKALEKGKLAVVTEADYNYILSQAAIVEGSNVDEAGIPLNREGEQAYGRMRDAQANIEPVSGHEKRQTWRIIGMLSSPVSSLKNIEGNMIMQEADRISTRGVEWLDKIIAKKTGTRSVGVATRQERKAGTKAAFRRGRDTFDDTFVAKTSTSRSRNYDTGEGRVYQTEALEFVRNLIGYAMDAPDQMFMEKTIVEEMSVLKRLDAKIRDEETGKLRAMTEGELYEEAYNRASERFYHDNNRMVKILNEVYNVPFIGTAARVLVPFSKTPSNVAIRMFDYSPLGLAKSVFYDGLYNMNRDKGADGVGANFDQRKFVMGVGRGMTGTAITAIGALLLKAGILEFGREDEENKERRNIKGELGTPYSLYINIGDTKHEIAFTMPALAGLAIGAGIASRIEDDETLYNIAIGLISDEANAFFDNSYLSSINDIFQGYLDGSGIFFNAASKAAEQYVTQMLSPAILRVVAKAADEYARDTTSSSQIRQMMNELVIQNWPYFRETLPIKYDVTGDAMTQHKAYQDRGGWANEAMHWFDSLLSPTATYSEKDDAALMELLDLSYVANDTGCLPKNLIDAKDYYLDVTASYAKQLGFKDGNKGKAFTIDLTDDEKRQINQEYGYLLFNGSGTTMYADKDGKFVRVEGIRELMNSKGWKDKEPTDKVKDIEDKIKEVKLLIMKKVVEQKKRDGEL